MADTLVERVTGQTTATAVPVTVGLVMTDTTLLGADDQPAQLLQPPSRLDLATLSRLHSRTTNPKPPHVDNQRSARCCAVKGGPRCLSYRARDPVVAHWLQREVTPGDHVISGPGVDGRT